MTIPHSHCQLVIVLHHLSADNVMVMSSLCCGGVSSLASFSRRLIAKRCLIATSLRLQQLRPFQGCVSERRCFSTGAIMSATPEQLLSFINSSPTPFHLVNEAEVNLRCLLYLSSLRQGRQEGRGKNKRKEMERWLEKIGSGKQEKDPWTDC